MIEILRHLKPKRHDDPLSLRGRKRKRILLSTLAFGACVLAVYHIKQQLAPGQQQLTIQTERSYYDKGKLIRDVIAVTQVVFLTTGTTFTRPSDWNNGSNTVECIGGGAGGNTGSSCTCVFPGPGGGGGGYSKSTNVLLGATVSYAIGAGGAANANGGDTTFNSSAIVAKGAVGATGGVLGTGATRFVGGNGGAAGPTNGCSGGGGGAAGLHGNGNAGGAGSFSVAGVGGSGDAGFGGAGGSGFGGSGGNGTEYDATHGSGGGGAGGAGGTAGGAAGNYGAGGGGGAGVGAAGGAGRQGLIVITYTPLILVSGATPVFLTSRKFAVVGY